MEHTEFCRARNADVEYIILHCSVGSPERLAGIFMECEVSTHYIIGQDGKVYEVCAPEKAAYHAGLSSWRGSLGKSLNDCSIGIELETKMLGQTESDYSEKQINALILLLKELSATYHIRRENILGHSDIAPNRKPDPGKAFPWEKLARENLGVWYDKKALAPDDNEEKLLAAIGYDTTDLEAARYAFCRHFYPKDIAVIEDIQALLRQPTAENFVPKDKTEYHQILRATAYAYQHCA